MISDVIALAASELGLLSRDGTVCWVTAVHEPLFDDPPALRAFTHHQVQAKVAEQTGCDPELVIVVHFRHAYLRDVLARHQSSTSWLIYDPDEVVPTGLGGIVGIRIPTEEETHGG